MHRRYISFFVFFSYSGNAWIDGLRSGGGRWRLQTLANLTIRSDIGMINSSPLTATAPIISLQHGCNHTIQIPGNVSKLVFPSFRLGQQCLRSRPKIRNIYDLSFQSISDVSFRLRLRQQAITSCTECKNKT